MIIAIIPMFERHSVDGADRRVTSRWCISCSQEGSTGTAQNRVFRTRVVAASIAQLFASAWNACLSWYVYVLVCLFVCVALYCPSLVRQRSVASRREASCWIDFLGSLLVVVAERPAVGSWATAAVCNTVRGYSKQFIMKLTDSMSPASDREKAHQAQAPINCRLDNTTTCLKKPHPYTQCLPASILYLHVSEVERLVKEQTPIS